MQKEVDSLVAQVNELEQRVAQGEFDPAKTKVLHLAINPESMAQAERTETIAALKTENEHLSKKVAELMESKATAPQAALLLGGESAVVMQKSQLLERKLKETELKMQRLKEVPTLSTPRCNPPRPPGGLKLFSSSSSCFPTLDFWKEDHRVPRGLLQPDWVQDRGQ